MKTKRKKKKTTKRRKRVSRDKIRKNAKQGDRGPGWFNLPASVRDWYPEKKGRFMLDFLPYEVSDEKHPDGVSPGSIWYKRAFIIHHGIGPENKSVVCPRSVGKKCPIHEELEKADRNTLEDGVFRSLRGQKYTAFNVIDPDDPDKVAVFVMSSGKFWSADAGLKVELEEGDEDNLSFFDVENGKTVKCRFSEDKYQGNSFLKVTRIEFRDREDMDEDEVLEKVVDLDKMFNVLSYKKLRTMLLQEDEGKDDDEDEMEVKPRKRKKKDKKKSKKKKTKKKKSKKQDYDYGLDEDEIPF